MFADSICCSGVDYYCHYSKTPFVKYYYLSADFSHQNIKNVEPNKLIYSNFCHKKAFCIMSDRYISLYKINPPIKNVTKTTTDFTFFI